PVHVTMVELLFSGASSMRRTILSLAAILVFTFQMVGDEAPRRPGPTATGFLLPNGWTISPAGKQVTLTDLPLNIIALADGKHALVGTSGYNRHELSLVDLSTEKVVSQENVRQSWFGLAMTPQEDKVWWSGGGYGQLHTFSLKNGKLERTSKAEPAP